MSWANLVIDHRNRPGTPGGFYAYQSFVAPSASTGSSYNEAFVGVSSDGGHTWTDRGNPLQRLDRKPEPQPPQRFGESVGRAVVRLVR